MKQRLLIALAVVIGLLGWLLARGFLVAPWGGTGLTLIDSHSSLGVACLMMLLLGVPALVGAVVVSATGNPLSGVFSSAFALMIVAATGGPIDDWLRHISGPASYRELALEMFIWEIGLVIWFIVIHKLRRPVRAAAGRWASQHSGNEVQYLRLPGPRAIAAGMLTAVIGAGVSFVMIRSTDTGQIIGSLLVGFTAGGLAGQMIFAEDKNPVAILLAPGVVAIISYLVVSTQYGTHDQLLAAWFDQTRTDAGMGNRLSSLTLVLPVFYISAGVVGAALGVGLGQTIQAASHELVTAE